MRLRRLLLIPLVAIMGVTSLSGCACEIDVTSTGDVSVEQLAADADVVAVGRVVHEDRSLLSGGARYVFEVATIYKGEVPTEVFVEVAGGGCGMGSIQLDLEMVLFGTFDDEVVRPSVVRTTLGYEERVIDALGVGAAPTEVADLPRRDGLDVRKLFGTRALFYAVVALGGLGVFSLVGKWVSARSD